MPPKPMAAIHITDMEAAINWWRERSPSPDGVTACAEVRALATVYALMAYYHETSCDEATMPDGARDAWLAWYATTPDAPCIAICSTSQGDAVCKGCGRTFEEVQRWTEMTPAEKRGTWRRITMDGSSWRFNRYAERAREGVATVEPATDGDTTNRGGEVGAHRDEVGAGSGEFGAGSGEVGAGSGAVAARRR